MYYALSWSNGFYVEESGKKKFSCCKCRRNHGRDDGVLFHFWFFPLFFFSFFQMVIVLKRKEGKTKGRRSIMWDKIPILLFLDIKKCIDLLVQGHFNVHRVRGPKAFKYVFQKTVHGKRPSDMDKFVVHDIDSPWVSNVGNLGVGWKFLSWNGEILEEYLIYWL